MAAPAPVRTPEFDSWCGALSYLVRRLLDNPDEIVVRRAEQVLREYDAEIEAWKTELDAFVTPDAADARLAHFASAPPPNGNGRRLDSLTAYRNRQRDASRLK